MKDQKTVLLSIVVPVYNEAGGLDVFGNQSSAVLTSTVWGDGLIDNPPNHAIQAGETVRFIPFSELMR